MMACRVGAINVEALTIRRTYGHTNQRIMMAINLDWLLSYRKLFGMSRFRVSTENNQVTGRKVRPNTDITITAIRKDEMAECL
jgi:hypothetical protein